MSETSLPHAFLESSPVRLHVYYPPAQITFYRLLLDTYKHSLHWEEMKDSHGDDNTSVWCRQFKPTYLNLIHHSASLAGDLSHLHSRDQLRMLNYNGDD